MIYSLDVIKRDDRCDSGSFAGSAPGDHRVDTHKQRRPDHIGHDEMAGNRPGRGSLIFDLAPHRHHGRSPDPLPRRVLACAEEHRLPHDQNPDHLHDLHRHHRNATIFPV